MRKFFLTIVFIVMTVFGLSAQTPLNLNNFNVSTTPGQCASDGKIKVTLPTTMGPVGTKLQVKLDVPGDPSGRTWPMEIGVTGKNEHEFTTLKAGTYTVTMVNVANNQKSTLPKVVTVTSSYVPPTFKSFKSVPPSCTGNGNDGSVVFSIQKGAKGPFKVRLTKGGTELYNATHNAVAGQDLEITIQGTDAKPITTGSGYELTVEDTMNGTPNCGETNKTTFSVAASSLNIDCMEFELDNENSGIRVGADCKFNFSFRIKRKDNVGIQQSLENEIKGKPGTAVIKHYDSAGHYINSYDITSSYRTGARPQKSSAYSFITNDIAGVHFQEGDIIELIIKLGKTPIVKKFKLDKDLVNVLRNKLNSTTSRDPFIYMDRSGSTAIAAVNRSDLNADPANPCPSGSSAKYLYVEANWKKIELPNPDDASDKMYFGFYNWQNFTPADWVKNPSAPGAKGFYFEIYKYIGASDPSWNATYTQSEISDPTKWKPLIPGTDYTWINNNGSLYADLTLQADGYYKVKFKTVGITQCYEPERIVNMAPLPNKIGERFDGIEINRGIFKGTVSIRKWVAGNQFNYPITVTVDYLDDGHSGTTRTFDFQTALPFEPLHKVTYTFPMVKEVRNPDTANETYRFEFGDLPPGRYNITIKDRCGNEATKELNLDTPMQYDKDEVKVEQGCVGAAKISYEIEAAPVGTLRYAQYTLLKKTATGYDQVVGRSNDRSHTFNNLSAGEYLLQSTYFYYARIKQLWSVGEASQREERFTDPADCLNLYSVIPSSDTHKPSDPVNDGTGAFHVSRVYLTVSPTGELKRDVVGTSCSAASGTGLIAVNVTNPEYIRYPLQFSIKNTVTGVETKSPVFGATSTATGYVFKNVPDGTYAVTTSHACGDYPDSALVTANNYTSPGVTYVARSTNPCNGDVVDLTFGGSAQLFNIDWFRIEANAIETFLGSEQTISDTVTRNTQYVVRYSLKDLGLCTTNSGSHTITVNFAPDAIPPVITGCPSQNIEVTAVANQCYGIAHWGVVTATDNCRIGSWSQTHQSGERFPIGTTSVTYVFKDTSGNAATCTFNVVVKSRAVDMEVINDFVDGTGAPINRDLSLTENFNYRITYRNKGTAGVVSSTLEVTLPNHPNITIGTPDVTGASLTIFKPTFTKSGNVITFTLPKQTLTAGGNVRTILIPISLKGECSVIGKPCMNVLQATYSLTYSGGMVACTIPEQTSTGSKTIAISTQECSRTEIACSGINTRLTAIDGFTAYNWYKNGTQIPNPLNHNYIEVSDPATYRVDKLMKCGNVTYTTSEEIKFVSSNNLPDPIRPQANGGDVCAGNNLWVSHFILCNQPSRNIVVNFRDSNIMWQKLKAGSSPSSLNCPNLDDSAWEDVHNNNTFVANAQGHFRLRVSDKDNNCEKYFYFDVFTNSLSGEIIDFANVTSYQQGFITIRMATAGLTYKYVLKNSAGNVVNQNGQAFVITTNSEYRVPITIAPDTYTVEVTSPALPSTCKATFIQKIEKQTTLTAKVTPKAWKNCNSLTTRFEADGGKNPYQFAIWSIDGVVQNGYTDYSDVPASAFIATIPAGSSFVERDIHIDQPGRYVFIAKDANSAYALTAPVDIYPEGLLGYTIKTRDILCGFANNSGQVSITYNTQQNVKSTLYKLDDTGARVQNMGTNSTGFFNNLEAGKYEVEIKIQLSTTNICTYRNRNIVIKDIESTLRAYAGVAEDISCDTSSPTKEYIVHINNVSGGTGTGYEFSTNNVSFTTVPILRVGSTASVVYVRDSNKCTLEIPITIKPIVPATVSASTVTYDCEGKGTFTVTTNPAGNYEYDIVKDDGTLSETRTSNVFTLDPGIYSVYVRYTPKTATGTTPNVLFKEDFGKGKNTCDSESVFITCNANGTTLGDNQYMITRQVPTTGTYWVSTPPSDASGVTDGRYLAINGSSPDNDNGIVYKRTIRDVVAGQEMSVSVNLFNLLPVTYIGGTNPNLVVRLYNPGNPAQYVERSLGELPRTGAWLNKKVTFATTDITANAYIFEIRNIAAASTVGSDLAVDDIVITQPTKICQVRAEGLSVKIDNNKGFKARGTTYDEKCGKNDGSIFLTVDNPPSTFIVEYQIAGTTTWTSVTLTQLNPAQGVATLTGIPAVNNGTLLVRKANEHSCQVAFNYTINKPVPLTVTATVTAPVSCFNTFATVRFTAEGGARPYKTFRFTPITGTTPSGSQAAVNNEADFNLQAGTYVIEVEDNNGCTMTATLDVPAPKPLQIEVVDLEPCFKGGNTGRLQVKVINGNGSYQFSKDGGATFESSATNFIIYENLSVGLYNFEVKDGADCRTSTSYTIDNPLRMQVISKAALTCVPNSEAEYDITYSGGKAGGARQFLWSNSPTANFTVAAPTGIAISQSGNTYTFKTKIPGDYYFKIRYQMTNGDYCEVISPKQEIKKDAPAFVVTPTVEGINCAGVNSGKILFNNANISGGVAPYTIEFNNGLTTVTRPVGDITGLAKGIYTLTIVDASNCKSDPLGLTVTEVPAMVVSVTHTDLECSTTGTQKAQASAWVNKGGTAPFTVTLNKNGVVNATRTNVATGSRETFMNLDIGNYQIVVEDAKSCKYTYDFVVKSDANGLDARGTATIGCIANSGEIAISVYDKSGGTIGANQYIAVYREGITPPYGSTTSVQEITNNPLGGTDTWFHGGPVVPTLLSDGSVKNASTYTFTGVTPGVTYTFIVYDANSKCTFIKEANIPVPTQSPLEATITGVASTTCADANDGKVFVHLKNWTNPNVTYQVFRYTPTYPSLGTAVASGPVTPPLTAAPAVGQDVVIENVPAGRYFVLFTEGGTNCTQGTTNFTIGKSASLLTMTATVTRKANCQAPQPQGLGKIVVDAAGGTAPYQYYYHNTTISAAPTGTALETALTTSTDNESKDVEAGVWKVFVRDTSGCLRENTVTVTVDSQPSVASITVDDACSDNTDYPIIVKFNSIGIGQHQYKIDGIVNWQNITVATETVLPIRLAPNPNPYTISFKDANGCETSTTFRVHEMIKFDASHLPLLPCGATNTVTINVTNITGGSGTYKFSLYRVINKGTANERAVPVVTGANVTGNAHSVITNGGIGSYLINIYDAATWGTPAECAKSLDFVVRPPEIPRLEVLSVTTPTCYAETATVRIKANPVDGIPYTFTITDNAGVAVPGVTQVLNGNYVTFNNVPSGAAILGGATYRITAVSAQVCSSTIEVTVTSPDVISTTNALSKKEYTCDADTGEVTNPQLHFDLNNVTGGTESYTRIEYRELASGTLLYQQQVTPGVTSYSYTLPSYLTTANSYYAQVYDTNGCSATTTAVTISPTLMMSGLTATQLQAKTCNVDENISVTLSTTTVYSGEPIEYSVSKVGWGTITVIPPVTINSLTYTLTLTEPYAYVIRAKNMITGCEVSTNYTVLDPNTLLLEAKNPQRVTCYGGTGSITLELTDTRLSDGDQVANGFSYTIYPLPVGTPITGNSTGATIAHAGLPASKYRVEAISTISGCKAETTFEIVQAEAPITAFAKETHSVTCDNNLGEILVTVSGGWAPYTVNIQGGAITGRKIIALNGDSALFTGLVSTGTPGGVVTYTVTVTDAWGCSVVSGTTQVGLKSPDPITATVSVTRDVTCQGDHDGEITIDPASVIGGSGSYVYTIVDSNLNAFTQSGTTFSNLLPGMYTVEIWDTWGCNLIVRQLEVKEPKPIVVNVTDSNLLVCHKGNDAWIEFTVDGGRPNYDIAIMKEGSNVPAHTDYATSSTTVIRASNLTEGNYEIVVTDSVSSTTNGCVMSPTYKFSVYSAPDLDPTTEQGFSCDNNDFTTWIEVRFKDEVDFNKITYKLNGATTPQTFSRNNGVNVGYIDQNRFNMSIATQTLEIIYTDVHSVTGAVKQCTQMATKSVTVVEYRQLNNIVKSPTTVINTLQVEGVNGVKPYRYEFNGEDYDTNNVYELRMNDREYTDPVSGKKLKIVDVVVHDAAGCTFSKTFYEEYFDVFIPNFFTPDGDGNYDTWAPRRVDKYPFIRTTIYDRYGRRLKTLRAGEEWDGKYDGRDMPTGDYWYLVELSDEHDTRTFNGNFTLYR